MAGYVPHLHLPIAIPEQIYVVSVKDVHHFVKQVSSELLKKKESLDVCTYKYMYDLQL